jgi:hypothetical protein
MTSRTGARNSSKERSPRGDCAERPGERANAVRGVVRHLLERRRNAAHVDARKPRRDRTRRGAGSETREVSGPRARRVLTRRKGAWARGYASLNRRRDRDPGRSGQGVVHLPVRAPASDADGPRAGASAATKALRGRFGSVKASRGARSRARRAEGGRHSTVHEVRRCGPGASAARDASDRVSRGGREPGGP